MRITIVTGPFYPVPPAPCGAMERVWQNLAEVFASKGHKVTVLCRDYPGQNRDETVIDVSYVRRTRMSHSTSIYWDLVKDFWYSLRMLWLIPQADITVTNVFWLPAMLPLFRRKAGAVVVNVNRWPKGQMKLYKKVQRIAAASVAVADEIARQSPSVASLLKVLPNPIATDIFVPPAVPRKWNRGEGVILFTGRLHPEKGLHLLVRAFVRISPRFPALRLRLIGATTTAGGGGGATYLAELRELAGNAPVEFVDPIYDRHALARELQSAQYYCYPSLAAQGEAFPVAPLEAMATGLPAIVSRLPVFQEVILNGQTGITFDHTAPAPEEALEACLLEIIENPELATRLSTAAHTHVQRYSLANVANACLDDFQQLVVR